MDEDETQRKLEEEQGQQKQESNELAEDDGGHLPESELRGGVRAIVAKRKLDDQVEMELFTPAAAKKARLIPDDQPRRRANSGQRVSFGGGSIFDAFFGGM